MKSKEASYSADNLFLIRSPIMPDYHETGKWDVNINDIEAVNIWIQQIKRNDQILESVFLSSPSLYHALMKWDNTKSYKQRDQVVKSLTKYVLRITGRPTPYGLFSGVSLGRFGEISHMELGSLSLYSKKSRIDMEWLFSFIRKFELNPQVVLQLKVTFNSLADISGERCFLSYNSQGGGTDTENQKFNSSIRFTEPVKLIAHHATEEISVSRLVKILKDNFEAIEDMTIINFIIQLVEQDYLMTNLRPSLLDVNLIETFLAKINKLQLEEELNTARNQFTSIHFKLKKYDGSAIGEGLQDLIEIDKSLKEIIKVQNAIQIDTQLEFSTGTFCAKTKAQVEKALNNLLAFSPMRKLEHLQRYNEIFLDRYSVYKEVPILELLNEDKGIGAPPTYTNPPSKLSNEFKNNQFDPIPDLIFNKFYECLFENKTEIILTDDDIIKLSSENQSDVFLPDNIELFCKVFKNRDESPWIFLSSPNALATGTFRSLGRFSHLPIFKKNRDELKEKSITEKDSLDVIYAQISYMPDKSKAGNVMISTNLYEHEVNIGINESGTAEVLRLDDILVGSDGEKLYLKSKKYNKRIVIKINNMVNLLITPNIFRFLAEVTLSNTLVTDGFSWGSMSNSPFLPRIRKDNIVYSPAKWNLNPIYFKIGEREVYQEWKIKYFKLKEYFRLPSRVYIVNGDNRLPISDNKDSELSILFDTMKRKKYSEVILLEEFETNEFPFLEQSVMNEKGENYNAEFVFQMVRNSNKKNNIELKKPKLLKQLHPKSFKPLNSELKQPGSEWMSLHLYTLMYRESELIVDYLPKIVEELRQKDIISEYFYIRYFDSDAHLRVRFKGNPITLWSRLILEIKDWLQELTERGILKKFSIMTYEREYERYGGPKIIEISEKIFYEDSLIVSEILSFLGKNDSEIFNLDLVATLSVLHFLNLFNNDIEYNIHLLEEVCLKSNKLEISGEGKKNFEYFCDYHNDWHNLKSITLGEELYDIFSMRSANMYSLICESKNEIEEYNRFEDTVLSILHMHCNRLIGTDRIYEAKIYKMALNVLKYLKARGEKVEQ